MADRNILVAGLPESGKTTFLAALWHLVTQRELPLDLEFDSLKGCDATHLNEIAAIWRDAKVQIRTKHGVYKEVNIRLKSEGLGAFSIAFPDLSGEDYRELWEKRVYLDPFAKYLTSTDRVLLFIHADRIDKPRWVFDQAHIRKTLSVPDGQSTPTEWSAKLAPTQVQLMDLLQLLSQKPFDIGPRRLCIVLSAWDKAADEELSPKDFFATHLPLLNQFLNSNLKIWHWMVVGVSAQGGDYGAANERDKQRAEDEADRVRAMDIPSQRIKVVGLENPTYDLTKLITWLAK